MFWSSFFFNKAIFSYIQTVGMCLFNHQHACLSKLGKSMVQKNYPFMWNHQYCVIYSCTVLLFVLTTDKSLVSWQRCDQAVSFLSRETIIYIIFSLPLILFIIQPQRSKRSCSDCTEEPMGTLYSYRLFPIYLMNKAELRACGG